MSAFWLLFRASLDVYIVGYKLTARVLNECLKFFYSGNTVNAVSREANPAKGQGNPGWVTYSFLEEYALKNPKGFKIRTYEELF